MRSRAARCVLVGVAVLVLGLVIAPLLSPNIRSTGSVTSPMMATTLALVHAREAISKLNQRGTDTHTMERADLEEQLSPVLRQMNERLRHKLAFDRSERLLDGWGNRVRFRRECEMWVPYSSGPNGRDEDGEGDDMK